MHQREIEKLRIELLHVDATPRMFDPNTPAGDTPAKRIWPRWTEYFAKGELARRVYDAIRENGSVPAGELACEAMTASPPS